MEITGTATHSPRLTAPVRVIREITPGTFEVVTLPGGKGGWARAGKVLTVHRSILTLDR